MESNVPIQINLPESQLVKMEELMRSKGATRVEKKLSVDKRTSMRNKNGIRDSLMSKPDNLAVQFLAAYFQNVDTYIDKIDEYLQKKRINFLLQLRTKLPPQDYKSFLSNTQLLRIPQQTKLIQEGKYHNNHYILLQGTISAYHQKKSKQQQKQYHQLFQYQNGQILLSNQLQTHKANPYTIRSKQQSLLLKFKEQIYTKYLKKIMVKEIDEMCVMLSYSIVFKGIGLNQIKKIIPFCSVRRFRYNQLVYDQGDLIRQLFLILDGEAQICYDRQDQKKNKGNRTMLDPLSNPNFYRTNHQVNDKKQIRVVRVGRKQLFGLEAYDVFQQNYYKHHVRVRSDTLKVLAIGLDVLYNMEIENPALEDNLNVYLKKINQVHCRLLEKSQQVAFNIPQKKKKKKRRMKRKNQNSLQWWGLAAKIEETKKYKLPTPPKSKSAKNFTRKEPLMIANRTSKLQYFKRRLFEEQMEAVQEISQKENTQTSVGGWVPRLYKQKLKMLAPHPKVMNNAERVKKKLLQYAKNTEAYCQRLQLQ